MYFLPRHVEIHEDGPREGFQIEPPDFSLADRVALVEALAVTGLKHIQVASFVNPARVPQMADAADLFTAIHKQPDVKYTALWLNEKGFEQALRAPQVDLTGTLYFYASDAFSRLNNGLPAAQNAALQADWIKRYRAHKITVDTAYIMTAFGCQLEGEISHHRLTQTIQQVGQITSAAGIHLRCLYLADTVGWANPVMIRQHVGLVRELLPGVRIGLHLHDTRGIGMATALAALQSGVDLFDTSIAGLGGCPFSGHAHGSASGNLCTEDLVFMCHEMGVETGIDLDRLIDAARLAERIIGRRLDGRLMHSGNLSTFRK